MRSHIGPEGPGKCTAKPDNCPFGDTADHFETMKEARDEYSTRLAKAYESVVNTGLKKNRRALSPKEQELRDQVTKLAQNLVAQRAATPGGITFEDANPERAKRRLDEAISYAKSRANDHLVDKLSRAKVLPSGAFKLEDGTRVNTDKLLQAKVMTKHIDKERDKMLEPLTALLREGNVTEDKWSVKTDRGTYSVTVGTGVDEDAFDKLPKKFRDKCMSPKESLNIDLARENIAPAVLRELTSSTQVLDFIIGKEPDVGQKDNVGSTELKGKTDNDKMQSGAQNIADFYDKLSNEHGRLNVRKAYLKDGNDAIKKTTAESKTNTFVPARSQMNGALVSGREMINGNLAREKLTPEQIKAITVTEDAPDIEKARAVLPPELFGKIFEAKIAKLRVTETKDKPVTEVKDK